MKKNGRIVAVVAIIAITLSCLTMMVVPGIVINSSIRTARLVAEEPKAEEPVVEESKVEKPIAEEAEKTEETEKVVVNEEVGIPTYYPSLSCSHLPSCQVSVVPDGYFTIGYKALETGGCDWIEFSAGDEILYGKIDEFHTYLGSLPYTRLAGFVESQFQYINACQ